MIISLRTTVPADEQFLFAVYASTRADELALTDWNAEQKRAFLQMQFRAQQGQYQFTYPNANNQIIEINGAPAGRLIVDRSENEILLMDISLLPQYRNLGLGTSLLRDLQSENKKITLHVIRSNPAAQLYQRLGFVFVGEESLHAQMEWTPEAARGCPWPGLCVPAYRSERRGGWSLRKVPQVAQFGYFQNWQGRGDIHALFFDEQTWMSDARDEVDSQTPHVASAFGHVVVMGAGMGIALYNLLTKKSVTRVTLVERDPLVFDLLRAASDLDRWRGIEKLRVEFRDALDFVPGEADDHLYADIWAAPGKPRSILDMQLMQDNVRATQVGWWGQELLFLDWLRGETPSLENYRLWAHELNLPLIEQNNPDYPRAVEQVAKSYCYRMFQSDSTRATFAQPVPQDLSC